MAEKDRDPGLEGKTQRLPDDILELVEQLESRVAGAEAAKEMEAEPVSYTHLDVYKRQILNCVRNFIKNMISNNCLLSHVKMLDSFIFMC